jgi:type II secretory pathway pseudopilin PulG
MGGGVRTRGRGGFSLAESILSVGIASTVLLAVVGMLAGTLGGARDTKTETVAGMVAGQLMAEAREDVSRSAAPVMPLVNVLLLDGAMQTLARSREDAGLIGQYRGGAGDPRAAYFARSEVWPSLRQAGMYELQVTVEAPAGAAEGNRKVFRYVSLLAP